MKLNTGFGHPGIRPRAPLRVSGLEPRVRSSASKQLFLQTLGIHLGAGSSWIGSEYSVRGLDICSSFSTLVSVAPGSDQDPPATPNGSINVEESSLDWKPNRFPGTEPSRCCSVWSAAATTRSNRPPPAVSATSASTSTPDRLLETATIEAAFLSRQEEEEENTGDFAWKQVPLSHVVSIVILLLFLVAAPLK